MSHVDPELPGTRYFEDVLPKTGWGLYYKFMVGIACASSFMHATAFLSLPFCIPLSSCEHLVTKKLVMAINMSFTLGRAVGGLILNSMCDIYGRKRFMSYSLVVIFLSSFTAAFAYNYYVIIFAAFILAFGLESNMCVVRVHLAEILPKNHRGYYLALCDVFWILGYICLSVFAVFLKTPSVIETRALDMRLTTWRMTFAICGGLSIILACTTALLEESPRYFLHVKKYYLALLTLKQFYAINKSSYGETFEVKEADLRNIVHDYDLSVYPEPIGCASIIEKILKLIFRSLGVLFSKPFLATTLLLIFIKIPLSILGPLDVNIWLAKQLDVNSTVQDGMDFIYLDSMKDLNMCSSFDENRILYYSYFVLASNLLFGKIMVLLTVDYFGRKISAIIGLLVCSNCFFVYGYVKYFTAKIILSSLIMLSFSSLITTVTIMNIESFPTALRGTSWGVVNFLGVFLSIFFVKYYYLFQDYFLLILGSLYFGAAVAAYFVDDLKRKPMIE